MREGYERKKSRGTRGIGFIKCSEGSHTDGIHEHYSLFYS